MADFRDKPSQTEPYDLDLEIGRGTGREYPVAVRSMAGEAHEIVRFPFDELALKNRLQALEIALLRSGGKRRKVLSPEEQTVREFGRALFESVFTGSLRGRYDVSMEQAWRDGKDLRIKLRVQDPELATLPWEFLYDPSQDEYICLTNASVVRYLDIPRPVRPLSVAPPLRVLGMAVSPRDLDELDVAREQQRIDEAIKGLRAAGTIELTWLEGRTWRDLKKALNSGVWHIFHFVGHGGFDQNAGEGLIVLEDDEGKAEYLRATLLARLLDGHRSLKLVVLNSCEGARGSETDIFAGTAATLVQRGIPSVLAMQFEITDRAAIEFSRAFYEAITTGKPIDAAVADARESMSLAIANTVEWGVPVLYMRAPDGRIFDIANAPAPAVVRDEEPARLPAAEQRRAADAPPEKPSAPSPAPALAELYTQAQSFFYLQQWARAIPLLRTITAQQPDYRDAARRLEEAERQARLEELYTAALQPYSAGEWDDAITRLEKVVAVDAGYRDAGAKLSEARRHKTLVDMYAEVRRQSDAQNWQGVVQAWQRIKDLDPAYPDPDNLVGRANEALASGERTRKLAALYEAGLEQMDAGEWARALKSFDEIVSLDPAYRAAAELRDRARQELAAAGVTARPREPGARLQAWTAIVLPALGWLLGMLVGGVILYVALDDVGWSSFSSTTMSEVISHLGGWPLGSAAGSAAAGAITYLAMRRAPAAPPNMWKLLLAGMVGGTLCGSIVGSLNTLNLYNAEVYPARELMDGYQSGVTDALRGSAVAGAAAGAIAATASALALRRLGAGTSAGRLAASVGAWLLALAVGWPLGMNTSYYLSQATHSTPFDADTLSFSMLAGSILGGFAAAAIGCIAGWVLIGRDTGRARSTPPARMWRQWVMANARGIAVGMPGAIGIFLLLVDSLGEARALFPALMFFAAALGYMQAGVLRGTLPPARWWLITTVVAFMLAFVPVVAASSMFVIIYSRMLFTEVLAAAGAVVGFTQWLVVRSQAREAGWWIVLHTLLGGLTGYAYYTILAPERAFEGPLLLVATVAVLALYVGASGRLLTGMLGQSASDESTA